MNLKMEKTTPTIQQKLPLNLALTKPTLATINEDYPKLRFCDANKIEEMINFILMTMNIRVEDTKEAKQEMKTQMYLIGDLLRTEFGNNVTIPEVKHAFKMYVSKKLNVRVFRLLDCITVGEVVSAYIEHRDAQLEVYTEKKLRLTHAELNKKYTFNPNSDEIVKMLHKGTVDCYMDYLKTGEVEDGKFYIFDTLYKIEVLPKIDTSDAVMVAYIKKKNKAILQIRRELLNKKKKALHQWQENEIITEIINVNKGIDERVNVRAKALVLVGFFDNSMAGIMAPKRFPK